jgi:hypothetical protein
VDLGKSYCSEEADRMGHCARGYGRLLSLRRFDRNGDSHSHVTTDYQNGKLNQIKGKQNKKPIPEYHKYIIDLLINKTYPVSGMPDRTSYAHDQDFSLSDLTNDQLKYVYENNSALRYLTIDKTNIEYYLDDIDSGKIDFKSLGVQKLKKVISLSIGIEKPVVQKILEFVNNLSLVERIHFIDTLPYRRGKGGSKFIDFIHGDDEIIELFNNSEYYFLSTKGVLGISIGDVTRTRDSFIRGYNEKIKRILVERNYIKTIDDFKNFINSGINTFGVQSMKSYFCDFINEQSIKFERDIPQLLKGDVSRQLLSSCTPMGELIKKYEEFTKVNNLGYFLFKKDGLWGAGFIDRKSKITTILNPEFSRLNFDSENSVMGRIGDSIQKINLLTGEKTNYKSRR